MTTQSRPIALAAGALMLAAVPAWGQGANCGPSAEVLRILAERHGESVIWRGQVDPSRLIFIFANPETGSWTAVVAIANGTSCIAASGVGHESMEFVKPRGERS